MTEEGQTTTAELETPPSPKPVLMAILAHPDDETFGMGGTLAYYARRGVLVYLVCATRGEVGTMDADCLDGFDSVAARRVYELSCASQILGLSGVYFLGYRDSGMPGSSDNQHPDALAAAPLEQVAERVAFHIRTLHPDVVITFDPIGGYRHPDHIAIHKATVRACEIAGEEGYALASLPPFRPEKLYFQTMQKGFLRLAVRLMPLFGQDPRHFGRNKDVDIASLVDDVFPINASIDFSPVRAEKAQAAACHASQGGPGMTRGLIGIAWRLLGNRETYMRAYPPPEPGVREKDLFAGINP
jgi:LmbE family N-acetylglucosaminyl deacetylase